MNNIVSRSIVLLVAILGIHSADIYLDSGIKTGEVTWDTAWRHSYGSCGFPFPPKSDYLVGGLTIKYMKMPSNIGTTNPNKHPLCGKDYCLLITGPLSSVVVKVDDTISGENDNVNVADTVFSQLADLNLGRVVMTWKFVNCSTNPIGPVAPTK